MNNKQYQTIYNEISYYANYDQKIKKETLINQLKNWDQTINPLKESSWFDVLINYFYSHTGLDGEITALNVNALTNKIIFDNYQFFKNCQELFLKNLFEIYPPLYFLDVDNTLTDNAILSAEKKNFISSWSQKSRIILSTGKNALSINNVLKECDLTNNYYSCLNGSVIWHQNRPTLLSKIGSISQNIINELNLLDIPFIIYYPNTIVSIKKVDSEHHYYLKKFDEDFVERTKQINYPEVIKILMFIKDDHTIKSQEQEKLVQNIIKDYPSLHCVRTAFHCYEILDVNQHKGNSVKKIAENLGYYYRASIGVGDSMNDFAMLNYTGKSYVVSNVSCELASYNFEIIQKPRNIDIIHILKKYERTKT